MKICDEGLKNLIIGIIEQAAKDYKNAILENNRGKDKHLLQKMIIECEAFLDPLILNCLLMLKENI